MQKMLIILALSIILIVASGCVSQIHKNSVDDTVFVSYKGVQQIHDQTEYRVMMVDSHGKHMEYKKDNAQSLYNIVNVSKYYNVTMDNEYITHIEGVPV